MPLLKSRGVTSLFWISVITLKLFYAAIRLFRMRLSAAVTESRFYFLKFVLTVKVRRLFAHVLQMSF